MEAEPYREIHCDSADSIFTILLNRPERLNAVTPRMLTELTNAFERADFDDDVRAVVVSGSGRVFCAGADLSEGRPRLEGVRAEDHRDSGGRVVLKVFACRKPIIAAINGAAVGFGATFTLPMDIRVASTDARFGFVFTRRGIVPEGCSTWFLPRLVGISRALDWVTTGRIFPASEALEAGLVRSVHQPADLLPAAHALAREIIAETAPVSVAIARRMLWRMMAADHPMEAHLLESRMLFDRLRSFDSREGIESFLSKRSPRFRGRVSTDFPEELI